MAERFSLCGSRVECHNKGCANSVGVIMLYTWMGRSGGVCVNGNLAKAITDCDSYPVPS
jgi:hypothetical protein